MNFQNQLWSNWELSEDSKNELENSKKERNLISFEKELVSSVNTFIIEENKGLKAELIDLKKLINKPKDDDTIDTIRNQNELIRINNINMMLDISDINDEKRDLE